MTDAPRVPASRLAASYVLGFCFVGLVIALWFRGAGRLIVPVLLLGGVGWVVACVVRKVREPLP